MNQERERKIQKEAQFFKKGGGYEFALLEYHYTWSFFPGFKALKLLLSPWLVMISFRNS